MEALSVFVCDFNFLLKVPKSKGYILLNLIKISAAEKHFKNQSIEEDQKDISHMFCRSRVEVRDSNARKHKCYETEYIIS